MIVLGMDRVEQPFIVAVWHCTKEVLEMFGQMLRTVICSCDCQALISPESSFSLKCFTVFSQQKPGKACLGHNSKTFPIKQNNQPGTQFEADEMSLLQTCHVGMGIEVLVEEIQLQQVFWSEGLVCTGGAEQNGSKTV